MKAPATEGVTKNPTIAMAAAVAGVAVRISASGIAPALRYARGSATKSLNAAGWEAPENTAPTGATSDAKLISRAARAREAIMNAAMAATAVKARESITSANITTARQVAMARAPMITTARPATSAPTARHT